MKKRSENIEKNKDSGKSKEKAQNALNKLVKNKTFWIVLVVLIILAVIIGYFSSVDKEGKSILDSVNSGKKSLATEITPLELIQNKEKYEDKTVTLKYAFIPSQAFVYIKGEDFTEKLFIDPSNPEYCLYFDLEGKLRRDNSSATTKGWIFYVDQFTCVKKR
jgi:hypothetical protein